MSDKPYPFVVAIIQARMGSSRFPGKMLADLCGKPLLEHVIDRVAQADYVHQVVVASPDEELVNLASRKKMWGFLAKDDPENVLARYMKCANWAGADIVVRITGDCPLIDPKIIDTCVKGYVENRVDVSTNVLRRSYPKGLDVEVLHNNVIKRLFHLTKDPQYTQHVTLYCYENQPLFKFHSIMDSEDNSRFNCSVDYPKDLDNVRRFLSSVSDGYTYKDLVSWLRENG